MIGAMRTEAKLPELRTGDDAEMTHPSCKSDSPAALKTCGTANESRAIVLSFDVEEHDRIEAAVNLSLHPSTMAMYSARVEPATRYLLDTLSERAIKATFFVVGEIARTHPALVREIHRQGHEIAGHGWDHKRVHRFTPATFLEDLKRCRGALEQVTGEAVLGYRAPTFSIVRETAWAIDVLVEAGLVYDSSIYPVRHDRYGISQAPRGPFFAQGREHSILELPPATLRIMGTNFPVGGGGYFRLLPLGLFRRALRRSLEECRPRVATIYFHPWEFDPDQPRLPLRALSKVRTYVGITRTKARLESLLACHTFSRAIDLVACLRHQVLPHFSVDV
jgi:polysaccharide deacetylase family protein (PEP-CTERM system associated)